MHPRRGTFSGKDGLNVDDGVEEDHAKNLAQEYHFNDLTTYFENVLHEYELLLLDAVAFGFEMILMLQNSAIIAELFY